MTVQEYNEMQKGYNKLISEMIASDEATADKCREATARALKVPVTESFFCQLSALCYYLGAEDFNNSLVLHMIHKGYSPKDVRREHERAILIVQNYSKKYLAKLWN